MPKKTIDPVQKKKERIKRQNKLAKVVRLKKPLTDREIEIIKLICAELSTKEIADKVGLSKRTVDTIRMDILHKTGCKNIVGILKYALRKKIISN